MVITLTTDFGLTDPFVGIMKGVIAGRAPAATIIDLTHGIPPQDVRAGALVLRHAVPYFPTGTVHVAVVDPGVGTERRALCVETGTGYLVGPDNGVLSLAASAGTVRRIVHLTDERFFLARPSATFHGRDVFAPVAAALATGTAAAALGVETGEMLRLDLPEPRTDGHEVRGEVIYVDRFGNLVTNVGRDVVERIRQRTVTIRVGPASVTGVAPAYGSLRPGEPGAVVNSWDLLEIAVRDGSARDRIGVGVGAPVVIDVR
jgi:S-adenosyl-L-methionine hydrolase (adenosine-forming)